MRQMKITTYLAERTTQKAEKFLSEKEKLESTWLLFACLPSPLRVTKKFSTWVYWKVFRFFLTNQVARFISLGIGRSYFSGDLLLSFLLWYDLQIIVKSSVNVRRSIFFFNWKLNISSFIFLIWTAQFWIWLERKLTKNVRISIAFYKVVIIWLAVWHSNLGLDLSIDNILPLGSADTKAASQDAVKKVLELAGKWKHSNARNKL